MRDAIRPTICCELPGRPSLLGRAPLPTVAEIRILRTAEDAIVDQLVDLIGVPNPVVSVPAMGLVSGCSLAVETHTSGAGPQTRKPSAASVRRPSQMTARSSGPRSSMPPLPLSLVLSTAQGGPELARSEGTAIRIRSPVRQEDFLGLRETGHAESAERAPSNAGLAHRAGCFVETLRRCDTGRDPGLPMYRPDSARERLSEPLRMLRASVT